MTGNDATLIALMHQGGWVMWALLALSVLSVAVTIERAWVLYRHRTDAASFLARLRHSVLANGSLTEAIRLCEATRGPLAVVAKAGLLRFTEDREEMERGMEAAARLELRRLERRLVILSTTANVAPLLGFLGTVTGMMASFGALVLYGTTNPALVAAGIQEALTTTAAGLTVAIPVQLAYNLLAARIRRLVGDLETAADQLTEWAYRAADGATWSARCS